MIKETFAPGFVILHKPEIVFDEFFKQRILRAMDIFRLDSSCPIFPKYHKHFGVYECNRMREYGTIKVELHEYCIIVREDVFEKMISLDLHGTQFLKDFQGEIYRLKLAHGLICNAVIYAKN